MPGDTFQQNIAQIVEGVTRRSQALDYRAAYMGTIVASTGDRCDVDMDDVNLFPNRLTNCRLLRPDGFTSLNPSGTRCQVFWSAHNPGLRYALMAYDGNGTVDEIEQKAQTSVTFLTPETIADKDLISEHEIGKSAGALSAVITAPATLVSIEGDDTAFTLKVNCADNMSAFTSATVTLGRDFPGVPVPVVSASQTTGAWLTGMITAWGSGTKTINLKWEGSALIGAGDFSFNVIIRGHK